MRKRRRHRNAEEPAPSYPTRTAENAQGLRAELRAPRIPLGAHHLENATRKALPAPNAAEDKDLAPQPLRELVLRAENVQLLILSKSPNQLRPVRAVEPFPLKGGQELCKPNGVKPGRNGKRRLSTGRRSRRRRRRRRSRGPPPARVSRDF